METVKMKPMGLNSTPFLSYHEINTDNTDLFDDAWGFSSEFRDVIDILKFLDPVPDNRLTKQLIRRIRQQI